ncbi:MAG: TlpA family protein disulfide reductase [Myxococcales bacterium]|nr:TlpA family protein disulfide reductase [Myxococcales bacterium]
MSPNLPVGGSITSLELGERGLPEGLTFLSLTQQTRYFSRALDGDEAVDDPAGTRLLALTTTLSATHFLGAGWSFGASLPAGLVQLSAADGSPARVAGLGDLRVASSFDLASLWGLTGRHPSVSLSLGLTLPTAAQATLSPDPRVPPTVLSLGAGTFGLTPGVTLTQPLHEQVALALPLSVGIPIGYSRTGRRPGIGALGAVDVLYLPLPRFVFRAGVGYEATQHASEEEVGPLINSGGIWLRARLGASLPIHDRLTALVSGEVPFYMNVNGRQIVETFTVNGGLALSFGGAEEQDHDHGHDHEEGPVDEGRDSLDAGDVMDVATGGETFTLAEVAVPGKVTVIDFWARWCHPCEHVDVVLRQLAAETPELAIRRAEVIDFEHPIGRDYFPEGGALPHLLVLDRSGKLMARFSEGDPEALRRRIRSYLRRPGAI